MAQTNPIEKELSTYQATVEAIQQEESQYTEDDILGATLRNATDCGQLYDQYESALYRATQEIDEAWKKYKNESAEPSASLAVLLHQIRQDVDKAEFYWNTYRQTMSYQVPGGEEGENLPASPPFATNNLANQISSRLERGETGFINYGDLFISQEFISEGDGYRQANVEKQWEVLVDEIKAKTSFRKTESFADYQLALHDIVIILFDHGMADYSRDDPNMTSILQGYGGNCMSRTRLLLAIIQASGIQPPQHCQVALQVYDDHIQVVIYDATDKTVWNPLTSDYEEKLSAPLYHPDLFLLGFVMQAGKDTPLTADDFLIDSPAEHPTVSYEHQTYRFRTADHLPVGQSGYRHPKSTVDYIPVDASGYEYLPSEPPLFAKIPKPPKPVKKETDGGKEKVKNPPNNEEAEYYYHQALWYLPDTGGVVPLLNLYEMGEKKK